MPFQITDTLNVIVTHLRNTHYIKHAMVTEPTQPPQDGTAAVFMNGVEIAEVMLDGGTVEIHSLTVRLYAKAFRDTQSMESVEKTLAEAAEQVMSDLATDFDLGGNIRAIDIGGTYGTSMGVSFGYVDIGGEMERIADIALPIIVDNSITATA